MEMYINAENEHIKENEIKNIILFGIFKGMYCLEL